MALKATVFRAEVQISDLDRHYYATHGLTLARHPSETDERMMVRLLAFCLFAHERLAFTRGLCVDDEPDLWQRALDGEIERWIDIGQPDARRVRRACGRAREVVIVSYGGRAAEVWWQQQGPALTQLRNLRVLDLPAGAVQALGALAGRGMSLQCTIDGGEIWIGTGDAAVEIAPVVRQG